MAFRCNVCGESRIAKQTVRGDGVAVVFCAGCGMGMVSDPPANTDAFYDDGYYGQAGENAPGYQDYAFTAEHTLLWPRLMVEALAPAGGRILDVGCADGFLLSRLSGPYDRFGIEVNVAAARQAEARGITVIAHDIVDAEVAAGAWGKFDIVTAIATFEHVLDLRGSVERCLDLLTSSGVLLFEVPFISDHLDSSIWFRLSYEHIYYPTLSGVQRLFQSFEGVHFTGIEADIRGYPTYIGAATRDPAAFARVARLFQAMAQPQLGGLDTIETRINLAFHVVHCFRPTPERVRALPTLLDVAATPYLLKHLTQLWHEDASAAVRAVNLERELARYLRLLAPILFVRRLLKS